MKWSNFITDGGLFQASATTNIHPEPILHWKNFAIFDFSITSISASLSFWRLIPSTIVQQMFSVQNFITIRLLCNKPWWNEVLRRYFCCDNALIHTKPWSLIYPFHQWALLLTWISYHVWLSNYIHYNVWGEIIYPFPNFNGGTVEVWE